MYVYAYVHTHLLCGTHVEVRGQSAESVLPFHHEYPEHQTQAVGLIGTNLDSLSILVIPEKEILARTM